MSKRVVHLVVVPIHLMDGCWCEHATCGYRCDFVNPHLFTHKDKDVTCKHCLKAMAGKDGG